MNIWGVFRCTQKHFVIHYEQCQNCNLANRLLADEFDGFNFDRATARQRGNGSFRVALRL